MTTLTMGRALLTSIAALTITFAAGCGSGEPAAPNTPPSDTTLRLSFLQDPGQPPDPDVFYGTQGLLLTTNLYEGLVAFESNTETPNLVPALATEWTASPDNRVFTFQLREGVIFHDGTAFESDAVKASFDRRAAVDQGPAYMVSNIETVVSQSRIR